LTSAAGAACGDGKSGGGTDCIAFFGFAAALRGFCVTVTAGSSAALPDDCAAAGE
jgi:hypothetical protein